MRVLVTGGAGFIGSHLVERALREGATVRVLDNLSSGRRENLAHVASDVELVVGDVRDARLVERVAAGCEVVFHEAAIVSVPYSVEHPQETHDVNIQGTLNVLLGARRAGARRVVFACSAAIYGDEPTLPKVETMAAAPMSPYGVEKLAGEAYLGVFARLYGLETVSLRYFNVFGPRQDPSSPYSGVISIFVDRLMGGRPITIYGDGSQSRDFVYVDNVAEANWLAATVEGVSGRAFNVGCGEVTTLDRLAAMLGRVVGRRPEVVHAARRPGDIWESWADIGRARRELGYAPRVGVEEGLARLVASLRR